MTYILLFIFILGVISIVISCVSLQNSSNNGSDFILSVSPVKVESDSIIISSIDTPVEFTFQSPFQSDPTSINISVRNNLSGAPCFTSIANESSSSLITNIQTCASSGYIISNNSNLQLVSFNVFTLDSKTVPAVMFSSSFNLYYSLSNDANGKTWSYPIVISKESNTSSFSNRIVKISRLTNHENKPSIAYLFSENSFVYVQGSDPTMTTILHTSTVSVSSPSSIALVFNELNQPVVFISTSGGVVYAYVSTTDGDSWNTPITISNVSGTNGMDAFFVNNRISLLTLGSTVFNIVSSDGTGSWWPSAGTQISSLTPASTLKPQLFVFDNRLCAVYMTSVDTSYIQQSTDLVGTTWLSGPGYQINSTGLAISPSVCVQNDKFGLAYLDDSREPRYGVYNQQTIETVSNIITTVPLTNEKQGVYDAETSADNIIQTALLDGRISFVYNARTGYNVSEMRFYRPLSGTLEIDPSFTVSYIAAGV